MTAVVMLACSVKSKDLKVISKFKCDSKKMFDIICGKYGSNEISDLAKLLEDFADYKLKSKKKDPSGWFDELDKQTLIRIL